ncbi:MAG TPA: glycine cleavage T C-terminal barrel domain-containing protein [Solirubrobacteraceae bacterium]|nr:glycine cleavage T C-terminal barrel domain-containing protein [Solirubrobacteraceae bacterium]
MAGVFADTLADLSDEHRVLVEGCGLVDRSERGKLALTGPDALEFLNGQVTNELIGLEPGEGRYAAFLTHKGKMLGDLRVLVVEGRDGGGPEGAGPRAPELLLDTERAALQALFDMIRRFKVGYRVELHKGTLERGLLSLIGPASEAALGDALAGSRLGADEHDNAPIELGGVAALAVRTDVGADLLCESADTERLAGALRARGARTVSEAAAECLRIERGRPRYGIDLDDSVIPQEAALNERAVSFTKGCYVGQETVARLYYKGKPNRHLRGLALSEPARGGEELLLGDRVVGRLTSVTVSPAFGPIGLALVRREAEVGSNLAIAGEATATVVELPFA